MQEAQRLDSPSPVGAAVDRLWQRVMSEGGAAQDITTLVTFFERWAGLIAGTEGSSRWWLSRAFFFSLVSSLPLMIPAAVVALLIRLFARGWFQGKVDELTA